MTFLLQFDICKTKYLPLMRDTAELQNASSH